MLLGGDFGKSSHVALWSDNIAYFCVEPMLTYPDDFDTPKGKYLKEEEGITLSLRLTVLDKT
jgi:galactose mutarotase-like enzyme